MAIWTWPKNQKLTITSIEGWAKWFGFGDPELPRATPESAMKLSAWWAATRLISETGATLPKMLVEKKDDMRTAVKEHDLLGLLNETPNDWQTPVEFWEGRLAPICTRGNSFAEKRLLGDRLVSLLPMKVDDVAVERNPDTYKIEYKFNERGKQETLPMEKVFHIRGFSMDDIEGMSPVQYASRSISGALAAEDSAAKLYAKGLRAAGFWKAPAEMDETQRKSFIENYVKKAEGSTNENSGRVVMPPGFDWGNFSISPKDAELILSRGFSVEDVCRWMGVPPILVGHAQAGQTMWGSGVEQIILGWLVLGLRAYLARVEASVNRHLISPEERGRIKFEFNVEGLLRADSAARAALMSVLSQNGLRTRDELRKLDNLPPIKGGDIATVQSALVPLEDLKMLSEAKAAPKPGPGNPDDQPEKVADQNKKMNEPENDMDAIRRVILEAVRAGSKELVV